MEVDRIETDIKGLKTDLYEGYVKKKMFRKKKILKKTFGKRMFL